MKKLIVALAVVIAAPAYSVELYPAHTVQKMVVASADIWNLMTPMYVAIGTTTYQNNNRTATTVWDTGASQSAPTAATDGLSLDGIGAVSVILGTASNATAGGTLQAYVYNPESGNWNRVPDLDLTAIASTKQSWPAIYVPVSRGRVTWIPNGLGAVVTTVYIVGQAK